MQNLEYHHVEVTKDDSVEHLKAVLQYEIDQLTAAKNEIYKIEELGKQLTAANNAYQTACEALNVLSGENQDCTPPGSHHIATGGGVKSYGQYTKFGSSATFLNASHTLYVGTYCTFSPTVADPVCKGCSNPSGCSVY